MFFLIEFIVCWNLALLCVEYNGAPISDVWRTGEAELAKVIAF